MTNDRLPDILVFMSDQHSGRIMGNVGDPLIRTPTMDALAANGVNFTSAYTSCPLCIPARAGFLTGQLPATNLVYTNYQAIPSDQATFLHALTAQGYETVLCGRMHFLGPDQSHGFAKRIFGEMTTCFWGRTKFRKTRGPLSSAFLGIYALNNTGKGYSPVLEYDAACVRAAVEYLAEPHEKPQCVVVGTYGPHAPYIAPPDLFDYYRDRVELPRSMQTESVNKAYTYDHITELRTKKGFAPKSPGAGIPDDLILDARAAYYGMIEYQDRILGQVKEAWDAHLERSKREGLFVYTSDHGQMMGERWNFGKQVFYEDSERIPFLVEGNGVQKNRTVKGHVSILDIPATLCELAGADTLPRLDGISLRPELTGDREDMDRTVLADFLPLWHESGSAGQIHETLADIELKDLKKPSRMIRAGDYKYVHYTSKYEEDQLFNLNNDPDELQNLAQQEPDTAAKLKSILREGWEPKRIADVMEDRLEHVRFLVKYGDALGLDAHEQDLWMPVDIEKYYVER